MFKIKAMDHIVLNVPDINRSLAFYIDVLGLEPERLDEFRRGEVRFPSVRISADTVIDLFPMKPGEALGGGPGLQNLNHFTMVVEAADFEGFQKHLAEHGVKIEDGPGRRWGARGYGQSVYFRDPDGNRIEVRCYPSGVEGRMLTIVDLKAELDKLTLLRGRTPKMTEVDRKGSGAFATLAPFRDGNIYSAKFAGDGAWERHPNGDELVQIIEGSATLHTMTADGPESYAVSAGMIVIVPQGTWHRFQSPDGVSLVTATPKPTEHLTVDVEDPRALTAAQLSNTVEEKWR